MKSINSLLRQGFAPAQAAETAIGMGENPVHVSHYLADIASPKLVRQHRKDILTLQIYLLFLNCCATGALAWLAMETGESWYFLFAGVAALLAGACWYGIARHRASAYLVIFYLIAFGSIKAIPEVGNDPIFVPIALGLNCLALALLFRLKVKLFPKQNFFHTRRDREGRLIF